MFYTFRQNNTGGSFEVNEADGIAMYVIIEAASAKEANRRAEDIGLYFDGCHTGNDCPCCGDRWYETSEHDATDFPSVYGEPVESYTSSWQRAEDCAFVHYADGKVVKHEPTPEVCDATVAK